MILIALPTHVCRFVAFQEWMPVGIVPRRLSLSVRAERLRVSNSSCLCYESNAFPAEPSIIFFGYFQLRRRELLQMLHGRTGTEVKWFYTAPASGPIKVSCNVSESGTHGTFTYKADPVSTRVKATAPTPSVSAQYTPAPVVDNKYLGNDYYIHLGVPNPSEEGIRWAYQLSGPNSQASIAMFQFIDQILNEGTLNGNQQIDTNVTDCSDARRAHLVVGSDRNIQPRCLVQRAKHKYKFPSNAHDVVHATSLGLCVRAKLTNGS